MKNLCFLLALILFLPAAQAAEYSVKYKNSTGEILAWGAMFDVKTSPGEAVLETDLEIPDIENYLVKGGKIVPKNESEKAAGRSKKEQALAQREARKQSAFAKIGLTGEEVQGLIELIKDGGV